MRISVILIKSIEIGERAEAGVAAEPGELSWRYNVFCVTCCAPLLCPARASSWILAGDMTGPAPLRDQLCYIGGWWQSMVRGAHTGTGLRAAAEWRPSRALAEY